MFLFNLQVCQLHLQQQKLCTFPDTTGRIDLPLNNQTTKHQQSEDDMFQDSCGTGLISLFISVTGQKNSQREQETDQQSISFNK